MSRTCDQEDSSAMLKSTSKRSKSAFATTETSQPDQHPLLIVEYSPCPEPVCTPRRNGDTVVLSTDDALSKAVLVDALSKAVLVAGKREAVASHSHRRWVEAETEAGPPAHYRLEAALLASGR
jgi:hypothetical protein